MPRFILVLALLIIALFLVVGAFMGIAGPELILIVAIAIVLAIIWHRRRETTKG